MGGIFQQLSYLTLSRPFYELVHDGVTTPADRYIRPTEIFIIDSKK